MSLKIFISGLILGLGSSAFAYSSVYCREVKTGGIFGQPSGVRQHCVEIDFEALQLVDNASTFFGNPPEQLKFRLDVNDIEVLREDHWDLAYTISEDGLSLSNTAGAVLLFQGEKE